MTQPNHLSDVTSQALRARGRKVESVSEPASSPKLRAKPPRFDLARLMELSSNASNTIDGLRQEMLKPHPRKNPPVFNGSQMAVLCGIDPKQVTYLALKRQDLALPAGEVVGARRLFTLAQARVWIDKLGGFTKRPPGAGAAVLACVNFKGGSTKTTTAFNLAQGLTLRGRRVLLVDLDPQASATTLTGMLPAAEVTEDQTAASIAYPPEHNPPQDLRYAVQSTYWDGMDLIPAAPHLFNAEILLPIHSRNPDVAWWDILRRALEPLKAEYDVVIFDTAPALSYLALNAMVASDGLIMPIPPENLDYASSVAFWALLSETLEALFKNRGVVKDFAFMKVLLSRVDSNSVASQVVKQWIAHTYGAHVLPIEIPKNQVNTIGAMEYGTVYDITRYDGDQRTYNKIRAAFDAFVALIDEQIVNNVWDVKEGVES